VHSPDHPYVSEHPEWFPQTTRWHDSVCGETPPKKIPGHLSVLVRDTRLESALDRVEKVCSSSGSRRVCASSVSTNPHTKSFAFWEWGARGRSSAPRSLTSIFLAEAFTRPKVMYRPRPRPVFTQSYNYFPWRKHQAGNRKPISPSSRRAPGLPEFFRAQPVAQHPGHSARVSCSSAAAPPSWCGSCWPPPLGASYGIYGSGVRAHGKTGPRESGAEEYLDSEKYQLRTLEP